MARQGLAKARANTVSPGALATVLAANVAEPLVSLGRWDEAADVIEHTLELAPPPGMRAVLLHLAGEVELARGDLTRAAAAAAAMPRCPGGSSGTGTENSACHWPSSRSGCIWRRAALGMR